eukprot:1160569-Pelagomonas_calceolata.AAC.3
MSLQAESRAGSFADLTKSVHQELEKVRDTMDCSNARLPVGGGAVPSGSTRPIPPRPLGPPCTIDDGKGRGRARVRQWGVKG